MGHGCPNPALPTSQIIRGSSKRPKDISPLHHDNPPGMPFALKHSTDSCKRKSLFKAKNAFLYKRRYLMSGYGELIFISCCFWLPYAVYFGVMLARKMKIQAHESVPDMA